MAHVGASGHAYRDESLLDSYCGSAEPDSPGGGRRWPTCAPCAAAAPLPPLSASSVSTFELCRRKWGFGALDGVRGQNKYAAAGEAAHAEVQRWLEGGPPPSSPAAQRGAALLPPPGEDLLVEYPFEVTRLGARWVGRLDVLDCRGGVDDEDHRLVVSDLKTTSALRWAKSEAELRRDLQACLYASAACELAAARRATLRWVYVERAAGGKARVVEVELTREEADAEVARHAPAVEGMLAAWRRGDRALDLPPTWSACQAYGGCPHRDRCEASPGQDLESRLAQTLEDEKRRKESTSMTSPIERIRAKVAEKRAAAGGGVNPPAVAEQAAVQAASAPAPAAPPPAATDPVETLRPAPAAAPKLQVVAPPKPAERVAHSLDPRQVAQDCYTRGIERARAFVDSPPGPGEQPLDAWAAKQYLELAETIERLRRVL